MSTSIVRNWALAAMVAASFPLGAALLMPAPAHAQSAADKALVDAAKTRGQIGEQGDGYLGFVAPSTDAALAAAVAAINAGRMQAYRATAQQAGVSVEAAGQATAQQLFMRLPPGQYYKPLNGDWTRKT
jgi:uncharacterized protein YdbL (DUF1318 family)